MMRFGALGWLGFVACGQATSPDFTEEVQSALGILRIDTQSVSIDEDPWDNEWKDVSLSLVQGSEAEPATWDGVADWSGFGAVHVRGNSSRDYEKKQYALETRDADGADVDVAFLGMPEEEDWVLQGSYSDKTLMRNHLMFHWSRAIGRYAPRTRFIELYMVDDGAELAPKHYRGVYVLTEKIKRDKHRVNVEKLSPDATTLPEISGGYVLKRDWVEGNVLQTEVYGDELVIRYPKEDQLNDAQRSYLEGYFNDFERALEARDGSYNTFIDLDSFADYMIMMELSRNVDAYVLSTHMYKPRGGLLHMGPIWDFNGSLGNADYFESRDIEGWHYENSEFPADNPNGFKWYEALLQEDAFVDRLRTRWTQHRNGAWANSTLVADIDQTALLLQDAQSRNFERWPVLGEQIWPNDTDALERSTYDEEIAAFKAWLLSRVAWLDSQWLNTDQ